MTPAPRLAISHHACYSKSEADETASLLVVAPVRFQR